VLLLLILVYTHRHYFSLSSFKVIDLWISVSTLISTSILRCFRKVKTYFTSRWGWISSSSSVIWLWLSRFTTCKACLVECSIYLSLEFSFHLLLSKLLLSWIQDIHRFEIKSTHTSHKDFLKIFLHHMLISILNSLISFCFIASLS